MLKFLSKSRTLLQHLAQKAGRFSCKPGIKFDITAAEKIGFLSKIKIMTKILIGFSLIICIFLLSGAFLYYQIATLKSTVQEVNSVRLPSIQAVGEMEADILNYTRLVYAFSVETTPQGMASTEENLSKVEQDLKKHSQIYETLMTSETEKDLYQSFKKNWNEYMGRIPRVLFFSRMNDAEHARAEFENLRVIFDQCNDSLNKLIEVNRKSSEQVSNNAMSAVNATILFLAAACVIVMGAAALIAVVIANLIVKPLMVLNRQLKMLAENGGDLTQTIAVTSADEVGILAATVNQFIAQLRQIMAQVLASARQVAASSEQLNESAGQSVAGSAQVVSSITAMTEGAERQASAVKETSAAIEKMSLSNEKIAAAAQNAAELALAARDTTGQGQVALVTASQQMKTIGTASEAVKKAIDELSEGSSKIIGIVDVISAIAGQTNLLALNAAIEAARAGEHGRGFAVVAEEVKKLAEQSAAAARQITALISQNQTNMIEVTAATEESVNGVYKGIDVVGAAENAFGDIAAAVSRLSEQIGKIAEAICGMTDGNKNILSAVKDIDGVSRETAAEAQTVSAVMQQQSAATEQVAAASQALSHMAGELARTVGKFTV